MSRHMIIGIVVGLVVLAGCGGSDSEEEAPTGGYDY
jgi:hypothetical protein